MQLRQSTLLKALPTLKRRLAKLEKEQTADYGGAAVEASRMKNECLKKYWQVLEDEMITEGSFDLLKEAGEWERKMLNNMKKHESQMKNYVKWAHEIRVLKSDIETLEYVEKYGGAAFAFISIIKD